MKLITPVKEFERLLKAQQHDDLMSEKYGRLNGMSAAFDDYHYWHEERTDEPGYYQYDYPLPYSHQHYFRRFVELFFSIGAERGMLLRLSHEFLGDEIDAGYINGLLISAERHGFFTPRAIIIFNGADISSSPPPSTKGGCYQVPPSEDIYQQVYEGSKANKELAKVIRKWLKRRAKELHQEGAVEEEVPDFDLLIPGVKDGYASRLVDATKSMIQLPVFVEDVADWILKQVLDENTQKPKKKLNARFWAIAEALEIAHIITERKTFALALGGAFELPMSAQRTKNKCSEEFRLAYQSAATCIKADAPRKWQERQKAVKKL